MKLDTSIMNRSGALWIGAGLVVVIAASVWLVRNPGKISRWLGQTAVGTAGGVVGGAIEGTGRAIYDGVNAVGSAISGSDWSLGAALWEWTHPGQAARDNEIAASVDVVTETAAEIEDRELGEAMRGQQYTSPGGAVFGNPNLLAQDRKRSRGATVEW